jgi:uncharacterized protein YqiB (DUF1249 family)
MIYQDNYKKLKRLGILDVDYIKKRVAGYQDLIVEKIEDNPKYKIISMAHYFEQNGDLMADPEMTVKIYPTGMCEALSYRLDSLQIDEYVYQTVGGQEMVNTKRKTELNNFLKTWLNNLIGQGFMKGEILND